MNKILGAIFCLFKGHEWQIDQSITLECGHTVKWRSCKRCNADSGYRDH